MKKEYAFPSETEESAPADPASGEFYSLHTVKHSGMTLRDYFAGRTLANGNLTGAVGPCIGDAEIAEICYAFADAMLKERKKVK